MAALECASLLLSSCNIRAEMQLLERGIIAPRSIIETITRKALVSQYQVSTH